PAPIDTEQGPRDHRENKSECNVVPSDEEQHGMIPAAVSLRTPLAASEPQDNKFTDSAGVSSRSWDSRFARAGQPRAAVSQMETQPSVAVPQMKTAQFTPSRRIISTGPEPAGQPTAAAPQKKAVRLIPWRLFTSTGPWPPDFACGSRRPSSRRPSAAPVV